MANKKRRPKRGRREYRPKRFASAVPEADAAAYVFDLIRSLMWITRDYRDFRLTTYFLEMAAMEIAPVNKTDERSAPRQVSRRATS